MTVSLGGTNGRSVTGFERFLIWDTADSFKIGSHGEPLIYLWRTDAGYRAGSRGTWERLRMIYGAVTVVSCLVPILMMLPPFVVWPFVRRFPVVNEPITVEEVGRLRRAVMDRSLAYSLLEGLVGWAIVCGGLGAWYFAWSWLGGSLLAVGAAVMLDCLRRLLRRTELPAGAPVE